MKTSYKDVLPEYPSVLHLPWHPNAKGDRIATLQDVEPIFESKNVYIQEKIDGANCGMTFLDGHPVVRNRTKILRKGQELKNPSQKQFASAWNWMHERKDRFERLDDAGPYSVYGEWMIQQHGMIYDALPEWFIAYDLYDYEKQHFLDPAKANKILLSCGFQVIEMDFIGSYTAFLTGFLGGETPDNFEDLCVAAGDQIKWNSNLKSNFAIDSKREGTIVKVSDGEWITDRFKMVRQGVDQGCLLTDEIKRNKLK